MKNKKLKITFLTPHPNISGGVKIIFTYASELVMRGHDVTIICPRQFSLIKNLLQIKPNWVDLKAKLKFVPNFSEAHIPPADIIVATAWKTASFVAKYSPEKGSKFYLVQGYESLWSEGMEEVDVTYKLPLKKIVVSSWLQKIMRNKFDEDSLLISNSLDFMEFNAEKKKYNNNVRVGMLHHDLVWKGVNDGVLAYNIAKAKYPSISLVMFGARAKNIEIDCEYHFKPDRKKINDIYQSCDIFLCASWAEGFGLTSAEAMACKCALVTTDTGGCRDFAIHEDTALVSPPKEPELLADNLILLLQNRQLLKRLATNGYDKINQFNWEDSVDKMECEFLNAAERI